MGVRSTTATVLFRFRRIGCGPAPWLSGSSEQPPRCSGLKAKARVAGDVMNRLVWRAICARSVEPKQPPHDSLLRQSRRFMTPVRIVWRAKAGSSLQSRGSESWALSSDGSPIVGGRKGVTGAWTLGGRHQETRWGSIGDESTPTRTGPPAEFWHAPIPAQSTSTSNGSDFSSSLNIPSLAGSVSFFR